MSVDPLGWRKGLKQVLDGIEDEQFQRETWFGGTQYVASPDEDICMLMDALEEFIVHPAVNLNATQREVGNKLVKTVDRFLADLPLRSSSS